MNWLLASSVVLGIGMLVHDGQFSPLALTLVLSAFVLLMRAVVAKRGSALLSGVPPTPGLAAAVIVFLVAGASRVPGIYVESTSYATYAQGTGLVLAGAVAIAYLALANRRGPQQAVFLLGVVAAGALRIGMLWASPHPFMDVFELGQQASSHLLNGRNPYTSTIIGSLQDGTPYVFYGYAYPPGNLYPQVLAYAGTRDVRVAHIVAEAVLLSSLWILMRATRPAGRELLVLLFLFQPRSLFVLEQAWTEPLILGCLGPFLCLLSTERWKSAALVSGFMLGLKHYSVFIAIHYMLLERRWKAWALAATVGIAVLTPFLVLNARSMWKNGFLLVTTLEFSDKALTVPSALHRAFGWTPNPILSVAMGLLAALISARALRGAAPLLRFTLASAATTFATFLFGAKAFCNYYYLVNGFMIAALAVSSRSGSASRGEVGGQGAQPL